MNKRTVIHIVLAVLLIAYLVPALIYSNARASRDMCSGLSINIVDSVSRSFVTPELIDLKLDTLSRRITMMPRNAINTLEIENTLLALDNIEKVNCMILNNGVLRIDVTPLMPVARVFDKDGGTYYINRAGKRMEALPQFRMDVPVITGRFNPNREPSLCFPLIDWLAEHPEESEIISAIEIMDNRDIVIVPRIKGHVVNLGTTADLDNKFARLRVFYSEVLPSKGWTCYDTISVKWRNQIVAHHRVAKEKKPEVLVEEHEDIDDAATMGGQIIPEKKAADKEESKSDDKEKDKSADKPKDKSADKQKDKESPKVDEKKNDGKGKADKDKGKDKDKDKNKSTAKKTDKANT